MLGHEITMISVEGTTLFVEYDKDWDKSLAVMRSDSCWNAMLDILENRQTRTEIA